MTLPPLPDLREALSALLKYAEINECQHDETHRGGVIWTICDGCGRKWGDDRNPFKGYQEPAAITNARAAIAAHVPEAGCGNIAAVPAQPPAPTAQPAPSEFEETDPDTCEHYCPHCGGSGEVEEADSAGPDARMVTVFCPHCDGHGTLIAAYRGVVKLLYAEKRKYMKVLGEWYCLKHFAQPVQQPDPAIEEALVDGEFEPRHWTVSACRAIEQNPSGALNIIQTLKRQLAAAQKPVQQPGAEPEPIMVEAVAEVRSGAEGLYLDWLIEGGICALVEGCVLVMPTQPITDDDGSGEVYLSAPAQRQPLTVPALTDAQMSECAWGYVADSRNLDAGVTGIIQATQLACAAAWGVTLAQKGEKL